MELKISIFEEGRIEHKTFDSWSEFNKYIAAHPLNGTVEFYSENVISLNFIAEYTENAKAAENLNNNRKYLKTLHTLRPQW